MVDYTTSKANCGSGYGIILGAAFVLLIVVYAIYAGGDGTPQPGQAELGLTAPATDGTTTVLD